MKQVTIAVLILLVASIGGGVKTRQKEKQSGKGSCPLDSNYGTPIPVLGYTVCSYRT